MNNTRSIAQIATDMDRIAKRRADINRLSGQKLIAYKRLEVELNVAKSATYGESYLKIADQVRAEIAALEGKVA